MKKIPSFVLWALVMASTARVLMAQESTSPPQSPAPDVVAQLKKATQELLDAIGRGDSAVWQKYLDDECVYTDEEGNVKSKADLLGELHPLPSGYVGSIRMGEPQVVVRPNVVVLTHRDREDLELFGQKIVTWFHSTDTWFQNASGEWKLAAVQIAAIPNERRPITVAAESLDAYVGRYELSAGISYLITREGGQLFGQRTGRLREELLPLCADTLYRKGVWRGEKVFERDDKGQVIRMLDRRENNDIVWRKSP